MSSCDNARKHNGNYKDGSARLGSEFGVRIPTHIAAQSTPKVQNFSAEYRERSAKRTPYSLPSPKKSARLEPMIAILESDDPEISYPAQIADRSTMVARDNREPVVTTEDGTQATDTPRNSRTQYSAGLS
ncbi:hypothetical protein Bbelb_265540 [Branchiostoma belcheri]|nr:hypothetical protein Bbelb_265540 [Branchiostoma belcheri]